MNIIVFGANSKTGKKLIAQGLRKGHIVTAFVRNPEKLQLWDDNLKVIKGDILKLEDVENAVINQDVVISALCSRSSLSSKKLNTVYSCAVKNIVIAMKRHNIRRLLSVMSYSANGRIFPIKRLVTGTLLRKLFADISRQEDIIKASDLDWTIVHPTRLTNAPKTENYRIGSDLPIKISSKISRADVADFVIKNTQCNDLSNRSIIISY